ncbi:MAG: hypothetical protein ACE5K7_07075 [Phycisphaerae bacterium]
MSLLGLSSLIWVAGSALAGPQTQTGPPRPSIVPKSWQLDLELDQPRRIYLRLPGQSTPQLYWYLLYRVTNNTGRDRLFFPIVEVIYPTPDGIGRVQADMGINPAVFQAIKRRHAKTHPFLIEPVLAIGRLLQGQDNAKTSVAIWPAIDPRADRFSLFIAGLSGQTARVPNPNYDPSRPEVEPRRLPDGTVLPMRLNPRVFTLRKVLRIDYDLPGDPVTRATVRPVQRARQWIMR